MAALDAEHGDLREGEAHGIEGERESRDVEVAIGQHFASIRQHQGAFGGAIELQLHVITRSEQRSERSAMNLGHAAQ